MMPIFLFFLVIVGGLMATLIVYLLFKWHPSHLGIIFALSGMLVSIVLYLIYQKTTSSIVLALLVGSALSIITTSIQNYEQIINWFRGET
jgi:hypothetical protein